MGTVERVAAQCKTCRRAIYVEHLDRDGNCCFCSPIAPVVHEPVKAAKGKAA